MSDEHEKVDDFVSLWKKKKAEQKAPSVIGDTLEKIAEVEARMNELEEENLELKRKIKANIDIIEKAESALKTGEVEIAELQDRLEKTELKFKLELGEAKEEIDDLKNRIKNQEEMISERNGIIMGKDQEITELKAKLYEIQQRDNTQELIESLQTDLSKKNSQLNNLEAEITTLQDKVKDLTNDNKALNEQLKEKSAELISAQSKPSQASTSGSTKTLEILCQDLQSDLNKYKRIVKQLKDENSQLKAQAGAPPVSTDTSQAEELKKENEMLRKELLQMEKSLKQTEKPESKTSKTEELLKDLQKRLEEKDNLIEKLQSAKTSSQSSDSSGAISGLVDDLQSKINKLKIALKEKNKIIEELKKK
ncbi:MAG: hypothetical protein ACTSR8_16485 [Promethearchaeota archaeon]